MCHKREFICGGYTTFDHVFNKLILQASANADEVKIIQAV